MLAAILIVSTAAFAPPAAEPPLDKPALDAFFDGARSSGETPSSGGSSPARPLLPAAPSVAPTVDAPRPLDGDLDGDGMDDAEELALANALMPTLVWAKGEQCGAHDALFQVHPASPGHLKIVYALIFPEDCGFRSSGFGGHPGDVQEINLDAVLGDAGWRVASIDLPWHEPFDPHGPARLFVSEGKHHIYPNLASCAGGRFFGLDHCGDGAVERPFLAPESNVGEVNHPLVTTLERYAKGPWAEGYAKETAWGPSLFGDAAFCGGDPGRGGPHSWIARLKSVFGWDPCGDALDGKWAKE